MIHMFSGREITVAKPEDDNEVIDADMMMKMSRMTMMMIMMMVTSASREIVNFKFFNGTEITMASPKF